MLMYFLPQSASTLWENFLYREIADFRSTTFKIGPFISIHPSIHTHIHTYIHTSIHTCILTYIHTYIHTKIFSLICIPRSFIFSADGSGDISLTFFSSGLIKISSPPSPHQKSKFWRGFRHWNVQLPHIFQRLSRLCGDQRRLSVLCVAASVGNRAARYGHLEYFFL